MDDLPDGRDPSRCTYSHRFLLWLGLLFLCKLGCRRPIDFQLGEANTCLLGNLNRLAGTHQTTRAVNKTVDDYLAGVGCQALADLRRQMI